MRWLLALLLLTGSAYADSINIPAPLYLQGSWTPTLIGSATPGTGQTYSLQVGNYEQVGRQVTVRFAVIVTSLGTAAGNMLIGGLPIAAANSTGHCVISNYTVTGLATLNYGITGIILVANPNQISLSSNSNTQSTTITVAQAGATANFQGLCSYQAS